MRDELLREIEQELEDLRRSNEQEEITRKTVILKNEPEIADLLTQREQLIQGTLRDMLSGQAKAEDLPEKMARISAEIRAALVRRGYAENYLAPVYRCEKCRDTGYEGDVMKTPCTCLTARYTEKIKEQMGLDTEGNETFERFDLNVFPDSPLSGSEITQRDMMESVRALCENWANQYPENRRRDVLLIGKSGLGKTFLMHCIANRLLERGKEVRLISAYSFLQTARKSFFENERGSEELMETPVLFLDDLGSEPLMQNVTIEQLFNLINERQARRLSTVISTNLSVRELRTRYTERIASRLTDSRNSLVITLEGQDVRRSGRN